MLLNSLRVLVNSWKRVAGKSWVPKWTTLPPVLIKCSCTNGCKGNSSYRRANINCSRLSQGCKGNWHTLTNYIILLIILLKVLILINNLCTENY